MNKIIKVIIATLCLNGALLTPADLSASAGAPARRHSTETGGAEGSYKETIARAHAPKGRERAVEAITNTFMTALQRLKEELPIPPEYEVEITKLIKKLAREICEHQIPEKFYNLDQLNMHLNNYLDYGVYSFHDGPRHELISVIDSIGDKIILTGLRYKLTEEERAARRKALLRALAAGALTGTIRAAVVHDRITHSEEAKKLDPFSRKTLPFTMGVAQFLLTLRQEFKANTSDTE